MSIAVIDIGKTNAKVLLLDAAGQEIDDRRHPNIIDTSGSYPAFQTQKLLDFVLSSLREFAADIEVIVPVTHGACAALVDQSGALALPVLDYEYDAGDMRDGYRAPPFAETGSPPLAGGLNLGVQLNWLAARFPDQFRHARHVLMWPQWWAHKLTGILASEVTSLGCHTDLWAASKAAPSTLARERQWDRLLPPLRHAWEPLGPVLPDIAFETGLDPATQVLTGIHDSNASLLPYLRERACTVLSTGTWIIAMAVGGDPVDLDPSEDMLLNVSAFGDAVPTIRFMGGRERDFLISSGTTEEDADRQIGRRAAEKLRQIGARGTIYIEGPFADSRIFCATLAEECNIHVKPSKQSAGTAGGAFALAGLARKYSLLG